MDHPAALVLPASRMKTFFLFLLGLGVCSAPASDPVAEALAHHRDLQGDAEGIAIAAIDTGATSFGFAGRLRAEGPPVGADTLFEIGSITKAFTGILLADAVLRGEAALEDPITKHLPADLLPATSPLHEVTLLDLATHTSGLPRLPSNLEVGANPLDPYAHYTVGKLSEFLRGFQDSDFVNRGKMSYSNLGMGLLGHLLERISGRPYPSLLRERILDPLGMEDSFVLRPPGDLPSDRKERFATGHSGGKEVPHWHIDALAGAGAMVSSVRDLARFAEAHWSAETPEGLRNAMELAVRPQRGPIGLGWFVDGDAFHHDGGTGGFRSELRVSPRDRSATIRLMNGTGPAPDSEGQGDFTDLAGFWEGTLEVGAGRLRQVLRISGSGRVMLHSLDQGGYGLPADKALHADGAFRAVFGGIGGRYEAKVEGDALVGTWKQNGDLPLTLRRVETIPPTLETLLAQRCEGDVASLAGWWSGRLGGEAGLLVIVEVEAIGKTAEARLYSPDQTPESFPVSRLGYGKSQFELAITPIGAAYSARLDAEGRLVGEWTQGGVPMPLTLTKTLQRPAASTSRKP